MQVKESKTNKHFFISMIKSVVRIAAGIFLTTNHIWQAGLLLILAEGLGIIEEF
jgi:hypothetical protein